MSHAGKKETKSQVEDKDIAGEKKTQHTELDNIRNALKLSTTLTQPAKPAVFQLFSVRRHPLMSK